MTPLEFDDIVFSLQRFGGITEYWRQMTTRIEAMPSFSVRRSIGTRLGRMRRLSSTCEIFHSSYYRTARGPTVRNVTTVHDLAYELGFVGSGVRAALHRAEHRRAFFASDVLICVSSNTRDDLLRVYPALAARCEILVIPHGVSLPEPKSQTSPSLMAGTPYILFVGGRGAYKNFFNALVAFSASGLARAGFRLLCTGKELSRDEASRIASLGLTGCVVSAGTIDQASLAQLYVQAYCLLYPSLFEGFGMPLLEAMGLGCPVVASNTSAIPEIAGDAALLVDGTDPDAIAAALLQLREPALRERLVARGRGRASLFTWERSASEHARVYSSLAGQKLADPDPVDTPTP